jgi:hypothetical protein
MEVPETGGNEKSLNSTLAMSDTSQSIPPHSASQFMVPDALLQALQQQQSQHQFQQPHSQHSQSQGIQEATWSSAPPSASDSSLTSSIAGLSQANLLLLLQSISGSNPGGRTSDGEEEEPLYVNAKQYNRILKRRQQRAKLEQEGKIPKQRTVSLFQEKHLAVPQNL